MRLVSQSIGGAAKLLFDPILRWVVDIDFYVRILRGGSGFAYSPTPLVNVTADAPHQITRQSEGNPEVELFEWFYLFKKHGRILPRYQELLFLAKLLERHGVQSSSDVARDIVPQRQLLSAALALRKLALRG